MGKIKSYLEQGISFVQESWTELSKVHFPSPRETVQATAAILVLTFVLALFLGLVDLGATRVVRELIG
jgi:preprotein translocase subunit SecE